MLEKTFGERVRLFRALKNLTQGQLADMLDISRHHMGCLERGESGPSFGLIRKLCTLLQVHPASLFLSSDQEPEYPEESQVDTSPLQQIPFMSGHGTWNISIPNGPETWSRELWQTLGYSTSREPSLGLFLKHVHQESRQAFEAFYRQLASGSIPPPESFWITRRDAVQRKIQARGDIIKGPGSSSPLACLSLLDITEWLEMQHHLMYNQNHLQNAVLQKTRALSRAVEETRQELELRKAAQEFAREQQEKMESILNNMDDGVWSASWPDMDILFISPSLSGIFGYSTAELQKNNNLWFQAIHSEDRHIVEKSLLDLPREKRKSLEYRIVRPDGEIRWINDRHWLILDPSTGTPVRVDGLTVDITQRLQIRRQLAESEEKFRSLTLNAPVGIAMHEIVLNPHGDPVDYIFLDVNPAFETQTGLKPSEVLGRRASQVLPGIENTSILSFFGQVVSSGDPMDFEFYSSPLQRFYMVHAYKISHRRFAAVFIDITSQKQMEQALGESERRYRGLVESQNDLIVRVDTDNRLTYVNDTYCRTFGRTREELMGKSFTPLVHQDDIQATLQAMEGLKVPPHRIQVQQRAMTVDGWRWIFWEDNAVLDEHGHIVEIQGVGRDITELKSRQVLLQSIFQASQDVSFVVTQNMPHSGDIILEFSPGAENLFGYSREEVLGKPVAMLHDPADIPRFPDIHRTLKENQPWRDKVNLVRRDGSTFPSLFTVYPFEYDGKDSTLGVSIDISELEQARKILEKTAITDHLTGLMNRSRFDQLMEEEWRRAKRGGHCLSILMLDIDNFKQFNDFYGHIQGDKCLQRIAGILSACLMRAGDVLARYGGEEFIALLPDTPLQSAVVVAEKMRMSVENLGMPNTGSQAGPFVSVSAGVASSCPFPGMSRQGLIHQADMMLYKAKSLGRNTVAWQ